ncbi:hypothetical protein AcW1_006184 [Taiwanofungus camphoratus]|nr:hypothetical protein AcW1_006184 [Antrodia cinnamomea]
MFLLLPLAVLSFVETRIAPYITIPKWTCFVRAFTHLGRPLFYKHHCDRLFKMVNEDRATPPDHFVDEWDRVLGSIKEEWSAIFVFSVFLLSATSTFGQMPKDIGNPITATVGHIVVICVLFSTTFASILRVHVGETDAQTGWAWLKGCRKYRFSGIMSFIFLAAPAIWLGWALLCLPVYILLLTWAPTVTTTLYFSTGAAVVITVVIGLGMLQLFIVITALKRLDCMSDERAEATRNDTRV